MEHEQTKQDLQSSGRAWTLRTFENDFLSRSGYLCNGGQSLAELAHSAVQAGELHPVLVRACREPTTPTDIMSVLTLRT